MFGLENTHTILNHCSVSLYWENTSNWDSFKKKKKKKSPTCETRQHPEVKTKQWVTSTKCKR